MRQMINQNTMGKLFAMNAMFCVALILLQVPASAADPAKGKKVFKKCAICHSLKPGKKKIGPSLYGIIGRKAGTMAGFRYSSAMKKAGKNGLTWTEETLDKYLKAPKKFIPGNRMPFPGMRKENQRSNVIAYLKSAAK